MSEKNPEKKTGVDKVEDDDDVVFIGSVIPKPMLSNKKKRQKQQIELRKSKSVDGSLVIVTQKLMVKKRKHRSKLNAGTSVITKQNVLDDSMKNISDIKGSFENQKSVNDSQGFVRITPICFRKSCRDVRCLIQSNMKKSKEKKRKTGKSYSGFPRDLKGLLSPVSLNSLSKSTDFEISLETSSFEDNEESNLDTLIKRTRERDRKNEMARTKQLCTPPHADKEVSDKTTEDKEICTDHIPLYTSTPKYEEKNDNNNITTDNNIEKPNISHDTIFKEAQSVLSPIKKSDNICTVIKTNNEQHVNNQNDSFTKQTNDISRTSSTNYGDNMSISDSDHFVQPPNQPISVLVGIHTLQSNTEHQNNVVNTNLGKSPASNTVCLCNNNDVAKLLSLNNNPHSVEHTPDKSSTNINKPLSNQDYQKDNDDGQIILNNNYNISQPLNQMCVPLSTNFVPISEQNMYLQLGLIQLDSEGKPIIGNKTDMQMSAFNNNQGLESNCTSGFYNNSCPNHFLIPYLVENNMQPMQFSEYQQFVNSAATNDHRNKSFSQNDDTTKKLYLDNSSFSSCSNKHIDQNVEQNGKPNQNYIPLHKEFEPNNTEYMSTPSNIFRDQNIELQNIYNFRQAQNQECLTEFPLSKDLLHKKPDYTHTSINQNYEQKIKDKLNINSSCDDYSFSWDVDVLIPENDEQYNKSEYIREDFPRREDLIPPPNNKRDSQASPHEDPHLDEGKYSKSEHEHEFPNIEHDKPPYHNNNFNRYSSRERSLFYDEIVEHRNLEYSCQRKYSDANHDQFVNDRSPRGHYRETFEEIDEYIHMKNEKFAYRRSSISRMNYEQNTEDRGMARPKENNNNIKRRNWNDKPNYDNVNDKYKDADTFYNVRDIEDENISMPDRFTGPKSRDYKQFLKDIRQKRFDYEKTVIDTKKNKQNTEGSKRCSSRNKKFRRSPFVEDFHVIENEESEYYMNKRKTYISNNYFLAKQPNKNYRSPFEDKRTHNKEFKKRNDYIEDIKRSSSEIKDKIRQKRDRNSFFEEEDFQYKKSDYTYRHTVHTNSEHKRRVFDNTNKNKPHIKNRNVQTQHTTQLNTVSGRKYRKVVHKQIV